MAEMQLNQEQLKAVKHGEGPLLIIAGAGTGKTTVITERIKYLITSKKVKPVEILALTFTEKAAREMQERVDLALPYGYTQMWISTFHAFGDRILRSEAIHLGLDPKYHLMTEAETIQLLRNHLFKFDLDYFRPLGNPNKFISGLLQHFSRLKDEDVSTDEYRHFAQKESVDKLKYLELAKAYQTYEELKTKEGMIDYADLIGNTLKLFRSRKNVLTQYQKLFKYYLVDEFQDTNYAQYALIKILAPAGEKSRLTVVGDDNQSIYKFRGAAISNIMQFMKDYPKATRVVLNKNYRSSQIILDDAYRLIKNNDPDTLEAKLGISKQLTAVRKVNETPVEFLYADRVENEADLVAKEIVNIKNKTEKIDYKDIAVLVRANNHAEPFTRSFGRFGIPFQFLGPGQLFKQPEVKDLIAYLKVLANFEDSVAMYRVLAMDHFKFPGRELAALVNNAKKFNLSLFEAAEKVEALGKIVEMIHRHLELVKKESAGQILYYFLENSGLLRRLTEYQNKKDEQQSQNIAKLFDKLKTYEAEHEDASVYAVVDWLNLAMELGESPLAADVDWTNINAVNLLTVHSAKGLEFPVVFLVNLVEQRFPTLQRQEQIPLPDSLIKEILPVGDFHLEEERRLFYVGMTRACDRLFLTAANYYGEGKREKKISSFVYETLGEKVVNSEQSTVNSQQLSILDWKKPEENIPIVQYSNSPINYLSYSQIETFNTCPLQYRYRYVQRIPVPMGAAVSFGNSVHKTLAEFYQKRGDLLKIFVANWSSLGYASKAHELKMKKHGEKILTCFLEKGFDPRTKILSLEQVFVVSIAPGLKIGGKIDRVDQVGDKLEIIDYKTGTPWDQKKVDQSLQMTVYALAANDKGIYDQKPKDIRLSFYFLETDEKKSTIRNADDLNKTRRDLIDKAKEINQSCFEPKPGKLCEFCDFRLICEAWN